jgi:hypothetical protein
MAPLLMLLRFVTGPQAPTIEGSLWGRGAGAGPVAVVLWVVKSIAKDTTKAKRNIKDLFIHVSW